MNTKTMFLSIFGIAVALALGCVVIQFNRGVVETPIPVELVTPLCFYKESQTFSSGFRDVTSVKIDINRDGDVSGEVKNIPAEKDSKVGTFEGKIISTDAITNERTADVLWDSSAEGMRVQEQLLIVFNDTHAKIGFGEMVDSGDGVYVYKDKNSLTYIDVPQTPCATFVSPQLPKPSVN